MILTGVYMPKFSNIELIALRPSTIVGVERHLWDHKNPYYGCRGAGLQEEQGQ